MKRILIGLVMFGIIMGLSARSGAESRRSGIPNQMNQIISGDKKPAEPQRSPDYFGNVKDLIQQLGDDDYQKRDSADKELTQLGDRLIEQYRKIKLTAETQRSHRELELLKDEITKLSQALREGTQSKDPEIKARANSIQRHFYSLLCSKIAFASERDGNAQIYVMDIDGKNQTRLTENKTDDVQPAWSPDGKMIAFESMTNPGTPQIYVMDADGKNQTRLTQNQAWDTYPAWSPDGKKIAFTSHRDGNDEIYVMDADGKNQTRLTKSEVNNRFPAWSPISLPELINLFAPEK